ncbi:MAG: DEAD/DEAH box helicase [Candidatus Pacebacteria bacterium]|jgi:superfamily II DNA/RNA helicase|nr:DEAD/DEAH box helicase [Candidatus Paceibacterota bacterium]
MKISEIIQGLSAKKLIEEIILRIHFEGPINPADFETLAYIKFFQPVLFKEYESKLLYIIGLFFKTSEPKSILESVYSVFADAIIDEVGHTFTPVQADAFKTISSFRDFSFSAPTSAGKSYLFRELILRTDGDIVIVVPSRALISEYTIAIKKIKELPKNVLIQQFIDLVNLSHSKKRIFVITPERGNEIFKYKDRLNIKLFLFDEAQIVEDNFRGMRFDALVRRVDKNFKDSKKVFAHPFIDNPEAQLKRNNLTKFSIAKNYEQMTVGKIFISSKKSSFEYFSPYILDDEHTSVGFNPPLDILRSGGTILVYTSKSKIYSGEFFETFASYIDLCEPLKGEKESFYIAKLKEYIGSDDDQDKQSRMIELMKRGIVIHHGSIPLKARLLIEEFVNEGLAKICFSTSTLLQGINMPFDLVWIHHFSFNGSDDQKSLSLKNLIGRAGRSSSKEKFDYGYVVVEEKNKNTFIERINKSVKLSDKSKLDSEFDIAEDDLDLVVAIKNDGFNDELQLTKEQVTRLEKAVIADEISYILNRLFKKEELISVAEYYSVTNTEKRKIKDAFANIFTAHLRRLELTKAEKTILSASIPILLWQVQGKSFAEIVSLRHAFLTNKKERRELQKQVNERILSNEEAFKIVNNMIVRFTPMARALPDINAVAAPLFKNGTRVLDVQYDQLVYDTYDYIDKVISLSLRDAMSAAFKLYHIDTGDIRANKMSNFMKYGTDNEIEIWLLRYGFDHEDIEWIKEHVIKIDENQIEFSDSIKRVGANKLEIIKQFL